ncbi:MAG: EamA family transporter [bacterium]|nr:EamA family transporter [bacterium]
MWLLYALIAAATAALVAIFGKIGLQGVDSTLATTVRGIVMAVVLIVASAIGGKFSGLSSVSGRAWLFIALSGLAGATSWLAYFLALKLGPTTHVSAIDRLSIVFVIVLAALFLGEAFTWKLALGGLLMIAGAVLIVW